MNSSSRVNAKRRLFGIACAVVALGACRATPESVIAEHRPAVEKVFGQVKALDAGVRNAPSVTADRTDVGQGRVRLDGPESNALYVRAENLAALQQASPEFDGVLHSMQTLQCAQAMRGESQLPVDGLQHGLPACGRAEYVFVQRTIADVPAQLIDEKTFQPGRYEGDVLLFRLSDGALLGGFRVSGKSSDSIIVTADETGRANDPIGEVNRDLKSMVAADISRKLAPYATIP